MILLLEERLQPRADVTSPIPRPAPPRCWPLVLDDDLDLALDRARGDRDQVATGSPGHAVLHGVLDEGLRDERGDLALLQGRIADELHSQLLPETQGFDVQVAAHQLELTAEGDELLPARVEARSEQISDLIESREGVPRGIRADEAADGVQRVEEEVGMELAPQRGQTRLDELGLQPLGSEREESRLAFALSPDEERTRAEADQHDHHVDESVARDAQAPASLEVGGKLPVATFAVVRMVVRRSRRKSSRVNRARRVSRSVSSERCRRPAAGWIPSSGAPDRDSFPDPGRSTPPGGRVAGARLRRCDP